MKFKNITSKVMPFKINGEWKDIQPGQSIELGENAKSVEGLELVESNDETSIDETKTELSEEYSVKLTKEIMQDMTKDDLNDIAVKLDLNIEINNRMRKSTMIKKILEVV